MIYVPNNEYSCYVIYDSETIRAYKTIPEYEKQIDYVDYYVNSHYMSNDGLETFTISSTLPNCIDKSKITSEFYYRNDFTDILIIFVLMAFICLYLPFKLVFRFFKKGNR